MLVVGCAKQETSDPISAVPSDPNVSYEKADINNGFPVDVTAKLSRDAYNPMVAQAIPSPEYVVLLTATNASDKPITFNVIKATFANQTTGDGMTSTLMRSEDDVESLPDDRDLAAAASEFTLEARGSEEHEFTTNGYTMDLITGLEPGDSIVLIVTFIGEDGEDIASYGCSLPDVGELPSKYDDSITATTTLVRLDD